MSGDPFDARSSKSQRDRFSFAPEATSLFVSCLVPSFHRRSMTSCAQKIPCSGLWDMWLNGTSRYEATDDAMFTLLLKATLAETAASIVDLRTNVDGWGKAPCRASTILRLADGDLTSKPADTARPGSRSSSLCIPLAGRGAIILSSVPHGDLTTWLTRFRYRITTSRSRCRQTLGSRPQTCKSGPTA
jgi:hypothetical protein